MFGPWLARARMQGDLQRQHDVRAMLSAATVTTAAAHEQLRAEHDNSVQQRDVEMALMNDALKALESQVPHLAREATEAMHGASGAIGQAHLDAVHERLLEVWPS